MSKVIMIQGTMSNAGKSLLAAGLCRIFKQDGYRVAPFKSQNMALNSFITKDGFEMGRAQVVQARAAGIEPSVYMNPILLKPVSDMGSQVIVNGKPVSNMPARKYFAYKKQLIPDIIHAFKKLEEQADIIVIEGAGSPAEINLKADDIVNMGLAKLVGAPVLLAGDIDRGGVFAQLLGTLMLLEPDEKELVKGLIINKFRGDKTILAPGIVMLEERGHVPVAGVIPYMKVAIEEEDSLSEKLEQSQKGLIDLAVIRLPRMSNYTDFDVFEQLSGVSVRYVHNVRELETPDCIFLPGSKNTVGDLLWMRQSGIEAAVKKLSATTPIVGICGGFQMLGESIADPFGIEQGMDAPGMGLLPIQTTLTKEKTRLQVTGTIDHLSGVWSCLNGSPYEGYEIHMGKSTAVNASSSKEKKVGQSPKQPSSDLPTVVCSENGMVCGSYVHGLFDEGDLAWKLVKMLADKKNVTLEALQSGFDYKKFQESQYDLLADTIRQHMDMDFVYSILREAKI